MNTLPVKVTPSKFDFCLSSKKGPTPFLRRHVFRWKRFYSKRKKFAPNGSKLYPFWVNLISDTWNYLSVSHFRRDLTCWKRNSKSQKLSPMSKMAENLPSVSSPLKPSATCSIWTGPSRSKLTMLLVNISLKVWSFKMAFLKKKKKKLQKLLTLFQ